jgi:hypothetical protein
MLRYRWGALSSILLVAAGCGGQSEEQKPLSSVSEGEEVVCTSADATSGFVTEEIERQGGQFYVSFAVTPSVAPSDALVGVGLRSANHYRDLAAIVRFNPDGFIDARNGSVYTAVNPIPYTAGLTRQIYMVVDLISRTYSVSVDFQVLAQDFSFRTEQANALSLDGLALKVDEGEALQICNLQVQSLLACDSAVPGQGFVNLALPGSSSAFTLSFQGLPRAANMDGVMGISAGPAAGFSDLAAALRFGPSGTIDVRNGSSYSVLDPTGYTPNTFYPFTVVADVTDHTFTVVSQQNGLPVVTRNLAFRPQQANVATLGNFAQVSDSSAGVLTVCDVRGGGAEGAEWIHDGERYGGDPFSLAVSNDRLLLSSATRTRVLDARGVVTREVTHGGTAVTDSEGNVYLVGRREDTYDENVPPPLPPGGTGSVYITKFDPNFNPIYTRFTGTTPDIRISSPSADDHGRIAFVLRDPNASSTAVMLHPDGETRWSTDYPVTAVTLASNGEAVIVTNTLESSSISRLDEWADPIWTATFQKQGAHIGGVVLDSLENVVFWGTIDGTLEFGGSTFTARGPEGIAQGLLGSLGPDGTPRFVRTTSVNSTRRAVADRAGNVIIAGMRLDPTRWVLERYDAEGSLLAQFTGDELLGGLILGSSGDLAVDSAGSVYWQVRPRIREVGLNYLVKLLPP